MLANRFASSVAYRGLCRSPHRNINPNPAVYPFLLHLCPTRASRRGPAATVDPGHDSWSISACAPARRTYSKPVHATSFRSDDSDAVRAAAQRDLGVRSDDCHPHRTAHRRSSICASLYLGVQWCRGRRSSASRLRSTHAASTYSEHAPRAARRPTPPRALSSLGHLGRCSALCFAASCDMQAVGPSLTRGPRAGHRKKNAKPVRRARVSLFVCKSYAA